MQLLTTPFSVHSFALASLLLLGACSKKNDDPTPATTYSTTWTADNKNYTATTSVGAVSNNTLTLAIGQTVSSTEGYTIALTVPAATGTYNLASTNTLSAYSANIGGTATAYLVTSGTATVTTLSASEIIGTFSFSADSPSTASTKVITNGKFAIKR